MAEKTTQRPCSPWICLACNESTKCDSSASPRVVGAEIPDVSFQVTAGEPAAAIVFVLDVQNDLGSGGFRPGVDGIGIGDDQVRALRFGAAYLIGLLDQA